MKQFLLACSLSVFVLSVGTIRAQAPASPVPAIQTGSDTVAQTAAEGWLALSDDGRYDVGYQKTAGIFQKLVNQEQWTRMVSAGRGPLGKLVTRKLKDSKATPTMPGAPDGQYMVIHYDTSFEKKAVAVETVTVLLDTDGQWKVCGYFIR